MIGNIILPLILLLVVYGLLIAALAWLFGRLPWLARWRFLAAVLTFGLLSSLLAAWAWPLDSAVYANLFSVLLGDALYQRAAARFGAADPAQAHLAVPWPLRPPQVYPILALPLHGLLGLAVQRFARRPPSP